MSFYLWLATGIVAAAACFAMARRRRFGSIALAAIIGSVLLVVEGADPRIVAPFALGYLALLVLSTRFAPIVHGVAGIGVLVLLMHADDEIVDWRKRARELFLRGDYVGAYEAHERAYDAAAGDVDFLEDYAQSAWQLQQHARAIDLLGQAASLTRRRFFESDEALRADSKNPDLIRAFGESAGLYARVLRNRAAFVAAAGAPEDALAELDRAMQNPHLGKHGTLIFASSELRMSYLNQILAELTTELELHHPDRVAVQTLLNEHLRASTGDSEARRRLIDPLLSDRMRSEVKVKLDRMWTLVHEADEVLGDIRTTEMNRILPARLIRAEVDYRLGRFLRAKEEMQCLLETPQSPAERQRALLLLTEMTAESNSSYESALWRRELIDANGGAFAPPHFHADYYEALFFAAEASAEFQALFAQVTDKYLTSKSKDGRRNDEIDLRTLGYRGVAALRHENDPVRALACLRPVYEALRNNRSRDLSILRPKRAKIFVESMLEASALSKDPADREEGIQFANILLEVSTSDPALRIRRANLLEAAGRYAEAAADLKVALRHSKLDFELFQRWIDVAEKTRDAAGNSPKQTAEAAAVRATQKLDELRRELDRQASFHKVQKLRQSPQHITRAFAQIFEFESSLASDPLIAWHMSQEFGRIGESTEARNFLFKAVTAEPQILPFRMRLGELRLDMGLYREAADDFSTILVRDPGNVEAAQRAYEALILAGEIESARRLRLDVMDRAPERAAIEFAVRDHLSGGRNSQALEILGPHLGTQNPDLQALIGFARLADDKAEPALAALNLARAAHPESPEIARAIILATAICRTDAEMLAAADAFVRLPRILPIDDLLDLLSRLNAIGKHSVAAYVADGVANRYPEVARRLVEDQAILANFRAGNASPLRRLIDAPESAHDYSDPVVRAAFGLALRERGAVAAALFLQGAREHGEGRHAAALPTAAAFALTPHLLDLVTFLGRYERHYTESAIPLADQPLWTLVRSRAGVSTPAPGVEPGAEGEIAFLEREAPAKRIGDVPFAETYLRFFLFRYAGEGFEEEARKLAESVVAADRKALSAARFLAEDLASRGDPAAATALLADKYPAIPGDFATFRLLGDLLDRSDASGAAQRELASRGKTLFPTRREPRVIAARAAVKLGAVADAEADANSLLDQDPRDQDALAVLVAIARSGNDPELSRRVVARIQSSGTTDSSILQYLVEFATADGATAELVIQTIGPHLAVEPRFYAGAALLAKALAETKQKPAILDLVTKLETVAPSDPGAAGRGSDFVAISKALASFNEFDHAIEITRVGLLANPGDVALRRQRVDVARAAFGDGAAIDDLEVLCVLAPRASDLLFTYGDLLLNRRGDKLDTVLSIFPALQQLAPKDPRLFDMLAKVHFLRPRHARPKNPDVPAKELIRRGLDQVRVDLKEAVNLAPGRQDYWYLAGVNCFLMNDDDFARLCLSKVTSAFRYHPRAKLLLEIIDARSPKP